MNVQDSDSHYIYIDNIPLNYRAQHLRNFFSHYVESAGFICFHFRHRPETLAEPINDQIACAHVLSCIRNKKRNKSKMCSFIVLPREATDDFMRRYNHTHWLSAIESDDYAPLSEQCHLSLINFEDRSSEISDLLKLIEFQPPVWMPRGNVGTPTHHFFNLIKTCQLEPSVISKLKLDISLSRRLRLYGAVPYAYDDVASSKTRPLATHSLGEVRSGTGAHILTTAEFRDLVSVNPQSTDENIFHKHCPVAEPSGNDALQPESDESAEEWDRFEALHDDPYKVQRRDKCNLKYEDKAELVWEKGGSGLVFHTDERTWRKLDPLRKEELFDEPGSFDWDINMEPYEVPTELSVGPTPTGHWGVSRDTSDLIDIQISNEGTERPHPSLDADSVYRQEICEKGYGQCLMRRMGWKPGLRLGLSSSRGLLSPVDTKGSLPPYTRTGLGYYGPRITKHSFAAPNTSGSAAVRTVYIRSLFDSSAYAASRSDHGHALSLLRRNDPDEVIKYRSFPSITTPQQSTSTTCVACSSVPSLTRTIILNSRSNMSKEGIAFVSGGLLAKN
ncbi:unnamed protein product [Dicrocoelium dendriticum]|nr:unnamed protein product [Dicrocoelium dendriticum]